MARKGPEKFLLIGSGGTRLACTIVFPYQGSISGIRGFDACTRIRLIPRVRAFDTR